jgi:hypothetical protein
MGGCVWKWGLETFMPEEQHQEEPSINEEAEAAARADRERLFQSRIPRFSDQVIAARVAEIMGRALGLDSEKVPAAFTDNLRMLREQLTGREPPPLEESRVPPTGE